MKTDNPSYSKPLRAFLYLEEEGARGCGHIGIVFLYAGGRAEKIYQSALDPKKSTFNLLLFRQKVKVVVRKYRDVRFIGQILDGADYFRLHVSNPLPIKERIRIYIERDKPYSSIGNNCAHFLHFALKELPNVHSVWMPFPKVYYATVKRKNRR